MYLPTRLMQETKIVHALEASLETEKKVYLSFQELSLVLRDAVPTSRLRTTVLRLMAVNRVQVTCAEAAQKVRARCKDGDGERGGRRSSFILWLLQVLFYYF